MLATRMFFWWNGVTPPPALSVSAATVTNGGTLWKGKYALQDETFWEIRERYLRRFLPHEEPPHKEPDVAEVATPLPAAGIREEERLLRSRTAAIEIARHAADRVQLTAAIAQIAETNRALIELRSRYEDEILMILLMEI